MTPEQAALYRGILINPHDDAPRLIYADYLDENNVDLVLCSQCGGDGKEYNDSTLREYTCRKCAGNGKIAGNGFAEQAEFIRAQIELTQLPPAPLGFPCADIAKEAQHCGKCAWCHWAKETPRRMDELMRISSRWVNGKIATAAYLQDHRLIGFLPTWDRGFIDQLHMPLRHFLETCRGLVESHPITKWIITDKRPSFFRTMRYNSARWHVESDIQPLAESDVLPKEFFFDYKNEFGVRLDKCFDSQEEASAALQEFCYHYARRDLTATEGECHEKPH